MILIVAIIQPDGRRIFAWEDTGILCSQSEMEAMFDAAADMTSNAPIFAKRRRGNQRFDIATRRDHRGFTAVVVSSVDTRQAVDPLLLFVCRKLMRISDDGHLDEVDRFRLRLGIMMATVPMDEYRAKVYVDVLSVCLLELGYDEFVSNFATLTEYDDAGLVVLYESGFYEKINSLFGNDIREERDLENSIYIFCQLAFRLKKFAISVIETFLSGRLKLLERMPNLSSITLSLIEKFFEVLTCEEAGEGVLEAVGSYIHCVLNSPIPQIQQRAAAIQMVLNGRSP